MPEDWIISGALLSPRFVDNELPDLLTRHALWPAPAAWGLVRRGAADLAGTGGPERVLRLLIQPLAAALGRDMPVPCEPVATRDGAEDGGYVLSSPDAPSLRVWTLGADASLDSPRRGDRSSPIRGAARVLRAAGECAGLVTNGIELRLLLCDQSGPDGQIAVPAAAWPGCVEPPDSFRVIAALAGPPGMALLPTIFEAARLHQTAVTRSLRHQARAALEDFIQAVMEQPDNPAPPPEVMWRQALTIVYRLLFILKLESSAEPGRGFSFATSATWRRTLSPNRALGPLVRRHLDHGADTGRMIEDGLRLLFRICHEGLRRTGFSMARLAGGLFDTVAARELESLRWGERASALLLDRLLWTRPGGDARERVHYGQLDVEELGRVYETLLELEPAIAAVPMARVRRNRLESVMPAKAPEEATIAAGRFFTRSGLARRSGGSYYTPNAFVRHLVRQALSPRTDAAIARADPGAILGIKVLDPAMGSGHFLVEACRFLADALYEAARRADEAGRVKRAGIHDALLAWLPSRSFDRSDDGPSRMHAMAICRRLVATTCLYGADRDPLAVELAKLSLWLESFAEGLPLTFLDHRLIVGDSIGGPFIRDMMRLPVGGAALDPLLARGVAARIEARAAHAMRAVAALDASAGADVAELARKQTVKARLDGQMRPLLDLARAWSGGARLGSPEANDAWLGLARAVADSGDWPAALHPHQAALLRAGAGALPFDLVFPEIFRDGGGFDAVLGNPPWDVVHHQTKEFLATIDPGVMDAPTKRERASIETALLADPAIARAFGEYRAGFTERRRLCGALFPGGAAAGAIDLHQIFVHRMLDCTSGGGAFAAVLPSSIHANEGTVHLRRRLLDETALESCFTFDNRAKWFDIHGRQKFSLLVARKGGPTRSFRCGFYLDSLNQLRDRGRIMRYDRRFLSATGGGTETFLELSGTTDLRIAQNLFIRHETMKSWLERAGISFGREAHMTDDSHRFSPIATARPDSFVLHEGKTFHQYTGQWRTAPRYVIHPEHMTGKPAWRRAADHYRLAFREISRSTDERTMIAAIIRPGTIFGHKATCEKTPWSRPAANALVLCAIFNSFVFDWCIRKKTAASVSLFMVLSCPAPALSPGATRFLAHGALVLTCRDDAYRALHPRQTGLDSLADIDPAAHRAAMDAAIARAYGLTRDHYAHILTGFSHKADPGAPARCLDAFDLLTARGAKWFYQRHDPLARVPLATEPASGRRPDEFVPLLQPLKHHEAGRHEGHRPKGRGQHAVQHAQPE